MAGLLLSWEHPTELFVPSVRKATISRHLGDMLGIVIATDITWGVYEDTGNSDLDAEYTVTYQGPFGENLVTVGDRDIERYAKPDDIVRVEFGLTRPDGSPDGGRVIELSDENSQTGQFVRRIVTNTKGIACFYGIPNAQLLIRVDGWRLAHNVVLPNVRTISFAELISSYGTMTDTDPRRSIGLPL